MDNQVDQERILQEIHGFLGTRGWLLSLESLKLIQIGLFLGILTLYVMTNEEKVGGSPYWPQPNYYI